jgi:hypothetical protein
MSAPRYPGPPIAPRPVAPAAPPPIPDKVERAPIPGGSRLTIALAMVALLVGCERAASETPEPGRIEEAVNVAELNELATIESACLAEQRRCPARAMSCDWGSLEEARRWRARCP